MNARPILMSAPMVRALLAGTKSQTRRVVKPKPVGIWAAHLHTHTFVGIVNDAAGATAHPKDYCWSCPYGQPGDLLWVRETWARNAEQRSDSHMDTSVVYRADGRGRALDNGCELPWRPSIFMPRWASRLTLVITDVRVERLQEISQSDCIAEGIPSETNGFVHHVVADYRKLWTEISGAGSWAENPWVWTLAFSVEKRNVDDVLRTPTNAAA